MPKIQVLDKHIAELIAAGEVVERPASVIKELVENSIDAGATVITVEIKHGGSTYMRVTDNGCGIAYEDIPTAFLRHATSKISSQNDLDAIGTLGFRGEALPSISAVSRTEIITRTADAEIGFRVLNEGGEITDFNEAGCPQGTTIVVRDLFFNTPARMKFLKKDMAEGNAVAKIMDRIALSHPEISFRFIRDGKEVLRTPGDKKLRSAIYAVFGKEFANELMPVQYEHGGIKVYGYICYPRAARPNRNMQSFFINGRCIRSKTAIAALEEAYKGSILVGKYPSCVLNMDMNFGTVDVNVHPAKLEVRFANERPIFDAIFYGVKSALSSGDTPKTMSLSKPKVSPYISDEKPQQTTIDLSSKNPTAKTPAAPAVKEFDLSAYQQYRTDRKPEKQAPAAKQEAPKSAHLYVEKFKQSILMDSSEEERITPADLVKTEVESILDAEVVPVTPKIEKKPEVQEVNKKEPKEPVNKPKIEDIPVAKPEVYSRVIGEAFNTYIILQYGDDKLMLIDKHAAHERLIYERLKKEGAGKDAQTMLVPVTVTLDKDDYTAILMNLDKLAEAGFETEDFGGSTVIVRTAPLMLEHDDIPSAVMEIAGYLSENKSEITTEHMDWIYHNIACRAAIKAGDRSNIAELVELAKMLEENPEIRYCPHGRPVSIIIKKRELEKQFGRIQ